MTTALDRVQGLALNHLEEMAERRGTVKALLRAAALAAALSNPQAPGDTGQQIARTLERLARQEREAA